MIDTALLASWIAFLARDYRVSETLFLFADITVQVFADERLLLEWRLYFSGLIFISRHWPNGSVIFAPNSMLVLFAEGVYCDKTCFDICDKAKCSNQVSVSSSSGIDSRRLSRRLETSPGFSNCIRNCEVSFEGETRCLGRRSGQRRSPLRRSLLGDCRDAATQEIVWDKCFQSVSRVRERGFGIPDSKALISTET